MHDFVNPDLASFWENQIHIIYWFLRVERIEPKSGGISKFTITCILFLSGLCPEAEKPYVLSQQWKCEVKFM